MTFGANPNYGRTGGSNPQKKVAGYDVASLDRFNPQQMQMIQQLLGQISPGMSGGIDWLSKMAGGDQSQFEAMEAPAHREFQGAIGQLGSRFSGASGQGQLGAQNSSGFRNALGSAASNFAQDLASNRLGYQRDAVQQLLQMGQGLLTTPMSENFLVEPKKSKLQQFLQGFAPIAGAGLGFIPGFPGGPAGGAAMGSAFGQAFS